jgi:hypothetical protein
MFVFNLLCWQKKNCRVTNSSGETTPSRHGSFRRQSKRRPPRAYVRPHLPPPVLYATPHLQHQRDKTAASPRRLLVLQQRLWCPTLPLVAPPTSSATAARDLAICSEIAQANGRSLLLLTVGMLVLLILKMKILLQLTFQVPMTVLRRFLVHL